MKTVQLVSLVVGVVALGLALHAVGLERLANDLEPLAPTLLIACMVQACVLLVDAVLLRSTAGAMGPPWTVMARAMLCGHAVNQSSPTGQLGELTKVAMIAQRTNWQHGAHVVVSTNLFMFAGNTCLIVVGAGLALLHVADPRAQALVGMLLLGTCAGLAAAAMGLSARWPSRWAALVAEAIGLPRRWIVKGYSVVARFRRRWRACVADRRWFPVAVLSALAGPMVSVLETTAVLASLGVDSPWTRALMVRSGTQALSLLTSMVPWQIGSAELGAWAWFRVVGMDAATGITVELMRKGRTLVFSVLGLALLAAQQVPARGAQSLRSPAA